MDKNNEISECLKIIVDKYGKKYDSIFNDLIIDAKSIIGILFRSFDLKSFLATDKPIEYLKKSINELFFKLDEFIKIIEEESVKSYDIVNTKFSEIYNSTIKTTKRSEFMVKFQASYSAIKIAFNKLNFQIVIPFIQVIYIYVKKLIYIIYKLYKILDKSNLQLNKENETVYDIFNKKYKNMLSFFEDDNVLNYIKDIKFFDRSKLSEGILDALKSSEMYFCHEQLRVISDFVNKNYKGTALNILKKICFPEMFYSDYGKLVLRFYAESKFSMTYEVFDPVFLENLIITLIFIKKALIELKSL